VNTPTIHAIKEKQQILIGIDKASIVMPFLFMIQGKESHMFFKKQSTSSKARVEPLFQSRLYQGRVCCRRKFERGPHTHDNSFFEKRQIPNDTLNNLYFTG
jgi:hypothetical protein